MNEDYLHIKQNRASFRLTRPVSFGLGEDRKAVDAEVILVGVAQTNWIDAATERIDHQSASSDMGRSAVMVSCLVGE